MAALSGLFDTLARQGADMRVIDIGYCKLNLLVVIGRLRR